MNNDSARLMGCDVGAGSVKIAFINNGKIITKRYPTSIKRYEGGEVDESSTLMTSDTDSCATQYLVSKNPNMDGINTNSHFSKGAANAALMHYVLYDLLNSGETAKLALTKPADMVMCMSTYTKDPNKERAILEKFRKTKYSPASITSKKIHPVPVRISPEGTAALCHHLLSIDGKYKDSKDKMRSFGYVDLGNATTQMGVAAGGVGVEKISFTSKINGKLFIDKIKFRVFNSTGLRVSNSDIYAHLSNKEVNEYIEKAFRGARCDMLEIMAEDGFSPRFWEDYKSSLKNIVITGGLAGILGTDFFEELFERDVIIGSPFDNAIGALKILNGVTNLGRK